MEYILWFPVQLTAGRTVNGIAGDVQTFSVADHEIRLHIDGQRLVFEIAHVASEAEAESWIKRLRRGLAFAMLALNIPFSADQELGPVTLRQDWPDPSSGPSERFDALVDDDHPHLVPVEARVRRLRMYAPTVLVGTAVERFVAEVKRGAEKASTDDSLPPRLETALSLFAAAEQEVSGRARLLTRVMALEALVTPRRKEQVAKNLVAKWRAEISQLLSNVKAGEEASLTALQGELRDEESIGSGLRRIVSACFAEAAKPDTAQALRDLRRIYNARSELTHEGVLDQEELVWASEASRRLCETVLSSALDYGLPS